MGGLVEPGPVEMVQVGLVLFETVQVGMVQLVLDQVQAVLVQARVVLAQAQVGLVQVQVVLDKVQLVLALVQVDPVPVASFDYSVLVLEA